MKFWLGGDWVGFAGIDIDGGWGWGSGLKGMVAQWWVGRRVAVGGCWVFIGGNVQTTYYFF